MWGKLMSWNLNVPDPVVPAVLRVHPYLQVTQNCAPRAEPQTRYSSTLSPCGLRVPRA